MRSLFFCFDSAARFVQPFANETANSGNRKPIHRGKTGAPNLRTLDSKLFFSKVFQRRLRVVSMSSPGSFRVEP